LIQTYLQGRIFIYQAVTIRFTDTDSSATTDVVFAEHVSFDTVDLFAEHLQTTVQAVGGNFGDWTFSVLTASEASSVAGTLKIGTGNAGFQVDFNQGGATTGTGLRRYLGHNSDTISTGSSTYYFASKVQASFYPERGALSVVRNSTKYDRIQMMTIGGHSFSQFSKDTLDLPIIALRVSLQFNTEGDDYGELKIFELFLDAVFDYPNGGEPFSVTHGDDVYVVWFSGGDVVLEYARMIDGFNGAWQLELALETYTEN